MADDDKFDFLNQFLSGPDESSEPPRFGRKPNRRDLPSAGDVLVALSLNKAVDADVAVRMESYGITIPQAPASASASTAKAPAATAPSKPSAIATLGSWTREKRQAAMEVWGKDKTKWADCRNQAADNGLAGQKSWTFLARCMSAPRPKEK